MDRVSALIYKERLFHYPQGRDFAGVVYEYQQDRQSDYVSTSIQLVSDKFRTGILSVMK